MDEILKELCLDNLCDRFREENVTPDIVCKLSRYDLQCLGLSNSSDIMNLRVRCIQFGSHVPIKTTGSRTFNISETVLENLLECGFSVKSISRLLAVSERTVYRRMTQFGLSSCSFSDITDDDLESALEKILFEFPRCGETMLKQLLATKGIKITRSRLRNALVRVDEDGIQQRKKRKLHRRVYSVSAPNNVWHVDTHHKLIRWNFVVAGGIDGFSRFVVYLRCLDNNRAETIFSCFQSGLRYGTPLRVRSDQGLENLKIAEYMLSVHNNGTSMIVGKSTSNQRIERLWRDIFEGVLSFFYDLFYFMEDNNLLDPFDDVHLCALHYVFLPKINDNLIMWREAWNNHRIRTINSSPLKLFTAGTLNIPLSTVSLNDVQGDFDYDQEQMSDQRPSLMPVNNLISELVAARLERECPKDIESIDFGIDIYQKALSILMSNN